jgi:hypothetical protein
MTTRTLVVRSFMVFATLAVALLVSVYIVSERRLTAFYPTPTVPLPAPVDAAAIVRGEHIVTAIGA